MSEFLSLMLGFESLMLGFVDLMTVENLILEFLILRLKIESNA